MKRARECPSSVQSAANHLSFRSLAPQTQLEFLYQPLLILRCFTLFSVDAVQRSQLKSLLQNIFIRSKQLKALSINWKCAH